MVDALVCIISLRTRKCCNGRQFLIENQVCSSSYERVREAKLFFATGTVEINFMYQPERFLEKTYRSHLIQCILLSIERNLGASRISVTLHLGPDK